MHICTHRYTYIHGIKIAKVNLKIYIIYMHT